MLKLHYFGHLESGQRADSLEKTLMLGQIERKKRSGWQRMKWLDGIIDSVDMSLSKLREMVKDREAAVPGVTKSQTWLRDWTTTTRQWGASQVLWLTNQRTWWFGSCRDTHWKDSKEQNLVAFIYIFKKIFNFFQYLTSLYFCYFGRADLHIGFVFLMPAKLSNHFADEGMDISRN